jgi:hypothetical protein
MWSVPRSYHEDNWGDQFSWFLYGSLWREDLCAWSWRISTVRCRCQGTPGKALTGWKKLSGCCVDLWISEISGGAVIACSSESCVQVVNKSNIQSKTPSIVTHSKSGNYKDSAICITLLPIRCPVIRAKEHRRAVLGLNTGCDTYPTTMVIFSLLHHVTRSLRYTHISSE